MENEFLLEMGEGKSEKEARIDVNFYTQQKWNGESKKKNHQKELPLKHTICVIIFISIPMENGTVNVSILVSAEITVHTHIRFEQIIVVMVGMIAWKSQLNFFVFF